MPAHMVAERGLHRGAGGVGGVDDAPMRVAALACQVVAELGVRLAGEGHAAVDQPLDRTLAVLDHEAGRGRVAQAGAGDEGVLDVGFDAVGVVEHRGDAALRPVACAVGQFALGHERHAQAVRQAKGHRLAGGAAAKDEYVVLFQQDVARAGFAGVGNIARGDRPPAHGARRSDRRRAPGKPELFPHARVSSNVFDFC
jgi:hypothetical protein